MPVRTNYDWCQRISSNWPFCSLSCSGLNDETVDLIRKYDNSRGRNDYQAGELLLKYWEYYSDKESEDLQLKPCSFQILLQSLEELELTDLVRKLRIYRYNRQISSPWSLWSTITSSNGNIFRVIGLLCRKFTGQRWILRTKASNAELWCFLWSLPEPTVEQTIKTPAISDASRLIMTSFLSNCNKVIVAKMLHFIRQRCWRAMYKNIWSSVG